MVADAASRRVAHTWFISRRFADSAVFNDNLFQDLDHRDDTHLQASLFGYFPADALLERLSQLHRAAWNRPLPLHRLLPAAHEEHSIAIEHHCANPNYGSIRIFSACQAK